MGRYEVCTSRASKLSRAAQRRIADRSAGRARRVRRCRTYNRARCAAVRRSRVRAHGWRDAAAVRIGHALSPYPDASLTACARHDGDHADAGRAAYNRSSMTIRTPLFACLASATAARRAAVEPICRRRARHVGGDVSASCGRRPRLLQLHRLRALRAAACCGSTSRRAVNAGRAPHAARRDAQRERRRRRAPTRSTCASGRGPTRNFDIQVGPRAADVRRVRAAHLRQRQPAHRLSAGLSVPDVAAAGRAAGQRRRAAPHARRAAGWRASRSATRRPIAACRSSARSDGTPACRCMPARPTASISATASVTTGTLSNPLFSDDNGGQQLAGRVAAAPGRRADRRRVGGARSVRHRRGGAQRVGERTTPASSRRPRGARDVGILARLLPGPGRNDRERVAAADRAAAGARPAAARGVDVGRRALQDPPGLLRRGASRSSRLQRRRRHAGDGAVGRAGHARRSRRRLLDSAQPAC